MFGNAPRPVWEKWTPPDSLGRIQLSCRALLIEFNGKKILCEAGIGNFFDPKLATRYGVESPESNLLIENLHKAGFSPDQIDYVILSHLHFDHAGGLLPSFAEMKSGNTGLLFPNAQYIVGKRAWERACHPHSRDRASFIPELNERLLKSKRLLILPDNPTPSDIGPNIEFLETDGHTPGQLHVLFKSPDHGKVFFCGDLIPGIPWVHVPITMGYDRFPERLIDEKSTILQRALAENWLLFFTHDPVYAAAFVEKRDDGRFVTRQTFEQLSQFGL